MDRPKWLKIKYSENQQFINVRNIVKESKIATVCEEAKCPNISECWKGGTATFMIMGEICTRACKFCSVKTGNPQGVLEIDGPERVANNIKLMKLNYVVLTSVDRDDLKDGGSNYFADVINEINKVNPKTLIEVLIPDFLGESKLIKKIVETQVNVIAHNVETVERLTPEIRDRRASYKRSLQVLQIIKDLDPEKYTKSSIMLGLGEGDEEVLQTLKDLREVACDVVTIGQYMSPSNKHFPIKEYITPEKFDYWEKQALGLGFVFVASGPLIRSSYRAAELFLSKEIRANGHS